MFTKSIDKNYNFDRRVLLEKANYQELDAIKKEYGLYDDGEAQQILDRKRILLSKACDIRRNCKNRYKKLEKEFGSIIEWISVLINEEVDYIRYGFETDF